MRPPAGKGCFCGNNPICQCPASNDPRCPHGYEPDEWCWDCDDDDPEPEPEEVDERGEEVR